ncbi:MAG: pyridoxamine 5'-phosphate oxidase family protein [Candidatus Paceibacterota bacterium]|jgi:predicted pyridoxine 5'-phosphate oxidase superfamily flavin-nucleotide-binding protein
MENLNEIKNLVENNPVALATVTENNNPNVIGVAFVKVISSDQILVTDNYMNQTIKDVHKNKKVCLVVWDSDMNGYKLIGEAEYFSDGPWKKYVGQLEENKGLPAKGAILVKISKIIPSK